MSCRIGIAVESDSVAMAQRAARLATDLDLPLVPLDSPDCDLLLVVTDARLELRDSGSRAGPVCVDFVGGRLGVRRRGGLSRDPLIRAVGRKGEAWEVVDVTAGLGRDAFLLAWAGCRVTMVERSPVLAALLEDGLARGLSDPDIGPVIRERLHLVKGDARRILTVKEEGVRQVEPVSVFEPQQPDAIYIDPMFPHRAKTALSKKEMRICRLVAGDDPDASELLEAALRAARHRVVVKRWLHAPPLRPVRDSSERRPAVQYKGRSIRYDVYTIESERKVR